MICFPSYPEEITSPCIEQKPYKNNSLLYSYHIVWLQCVNLTGA